MPRKPAKKKVTKNRPGRKPGSGLWNYKTYLKKIEELSKNLCTQKFIAHECNLSAAQFSVYVNEKDKVTGEFTERALALQNALSRGRVEVEDIAKAVIVDAMLDPNNPNHYRAAKDILTYKFGWKTSENQTQVIVNNEIKTENPFEQLSDEELEQKAEEEVIH